MSRHHLASNENDLLEYEIDDKGLCVIHNLVKEFSVKKYREYLVLFANKLLDLQEQFGVQTVYMAATLDNKKLQKYAKMFGFSEFHRDETYVYMSRPTYIGS